MTYSRRVCTGWPVIIRLMGIDRCRVAVTACVLLCGCSAVHPTNPPQVAAPPELLGKVWLSTDAAAAPGTLRIFLPEGTLLMDSCGETYRLSRWRAIDDRRVEWQEDTARIEAGITRLTPESLQLRLLLAGAIKEENYRLAQVPFVCPDMPR